MFFHGVKTTSYLKANTTSSLRLEFVLCWISKAAPHGVKFIMICQWSRLRWWKSSILELFLWVVKEKLVSATTSVNSHNEKQKCIFTEENNYPIWWLLFLSTRHLSSAGWYSYSSCHLLSYTFSKALSLPSGKAWVCFLIWRWQKKLPVWQAKLKIIW